MRLSIAAYRLLSLQNNNRASLLVSVEDNWIFPALVIETSLVISASVAIDAAVEICPHQIMSSDVTIPATAILVVALSPASTATCKLNADFDCVIAMISNTPFYSELSVQYTQS